MLRIATVDTVALAPLLDDATTARLIDRLGQVVKDFPLNIVNMWVSGESPKEFAQRTGRRLTTVYRIRKAFERAMSEVIIEELKLEVLDDSSTKSGSTESRSSVPKVLERSVRASKTGGDSTEEILSAMERLDAAELQRLVPRAIALGAARRARHLKPTESKLLARANEALPQDLKSRLFKLQKKRDIRSLSAAETEELIALSDRTEQLHAERLEALAQLARLRGKTLTELMDQLGIRFPANA